MTRGAAVALLLLLTACESGSGPGAWQEESAWRWRALAPAGKAAPGFTALPAGRTGIAFANRVSDSAAYRNRHLMHGSGVAIGDVDGDGLADVFLTRIEGPSALYRNLGGWRFEDIAATAGVALGDRPATGAMLADLDGDGDNDLVVLSMGGGTALFTNDGHGRFTEVTRAAGLATDPLGSTTVAAADVEGDGDLDLYVANYKTRNMLDSLSPQQRAFDQVVRKVGDRYEVIPDRRADYRVVDRPDIGGLVLVQRADPDWFYRNDGAGRFTREPIANNPRFLDESGQPFREEPEDFGLAARFYDINADGAPDLYVANDFEDPDRFWLNDGAGRFRLIDRQAIRRTANSNMAVDFADIDRDGAVDIYQVDMLANDSRRLKTQIPTHTSTQKTLGDYTERAQWQRNALLLNRGDGTFAEIADYAGVAASGWSWSTQFLDVDLDGYEDILIGTGHTWDLMDADIQERLKGTLTGADWRQERKFYPALSLRNVAFRNRGDRTFEDAGAAWRWGVEEDVSHGMAAGDLDGDGDLDVVVNRLNAPPAVMRNDAPGGRIAVRLAGRRPNAAGIGAVVTVTGGAVERQSREVTAGGLYLSSSEPALAFGTGTAKAVTLEVRWRDGGITRVPGAVPGRLYEVREPGSRNAGELESEEKPPAPELPRSPAPLFQDASALLGGHRHTDTRFNDYVRQPLLDFQLSQLGPGVSWIDLDADGDDDLVIPDGGGGELAWHRNDQGKFTRVPLGIPAGDLDFAATLWMPGPDGTVLLVARSTYQAASFAEALTVGQVAAIRLSPRGGVAELKAAVGPDTASVGAMALADVDGDGDLDLFVGSRVTPGAYPVPPASHLYRNESGRFVRDTANEAVLRQAGMVSAAVFTDLDGDGQPDLALAIDWGPVRVFHNAAGRLTDVTASMGLSGTLGSWKGISAGDFDGDGRMDLVATNWGSNVPFAADSASPLFLYVGNFGATSSVDLVTAAYDPRIKAIAPLASLSRLSWALRDLRGRVPTFSGYADAPIDRVLGPAAARAQRLRLTTLDHVLLRNRGSRFEVRALPAEAQLAPGFAPVVGDFDGDGAEDLFLAQNFSQTEIGTPRFDGGRGLLLSGDGKGGLTPVPGARSGIVVYGDQRGAAASDFDRDGRLDLAVSQTAAETKLYHNTGAAPGLRVRLIGGGGNPAAVGAAVRLQYSDGSGPIREVRAGSGYWSSDGLVQVLGVRTGASPKAVWVRWPGGAVQTVEIPAGAREVEVRR